MKIIVMNSADVRIEVLTVSDRLIENDDIEQFLSEHGYSLNNISWMAAPEYLGDTCYAIDVMLLLLGLSQQHL